MRVQRCRARNSATVYPSPRLAPVIRATRTVGAGAPGLELCAMSAQGRRRFISLLVYKMYKHPTRLEPMPRQPMAHLWPVAVPIESIVLDIRAARNHLLHTLREAPKAASPADLQSYLGLPVRVLGLSVPMMHAILAAFAKDHRTLGAAEVNALADALWSGPAFEEKSLAILLLGRYEKILDDDSWRLADRWVETATGWGLSDGLASGPIAGMVYAKASRFQDVLQWTRAKNIWRRRASTYALHRFVRAGDLDRPFQLLEKLLYDEEFGVQRAVGTWLRECWKKDRRRTEAFLRKHARLASDRHLGGNRTRTESLPRGTPTKTLIEF